VIVRFNRVTKNVIVKSMKNELKVSGMSCGGCELLVREALEELEGVLQSDASHIKGTVEVDYDPAKVSLTAIMAVIEEQGFKVKT